jgi:tetratricopeptide (TPR) repeat protein
MSKLQLHQLMLGFFRQGRYREAAACEEIVLEVFPDDSTAAYNLACAYSRMGARKDAVKLLKLSVRNGFRDWAAMEKDADLDNIRGDPGYQEVLGELKSAPAAPQAAGS